MIVSILKIFDLNNIKIGEKSYKSILNYDIGYLRIIDWKYIKIKSVNPLYLICNKLNEYFEEIIGNKCLTLVPTNGNKEKIEKYKEFWSKVRDLIRLITKNSGDYDEKYMKIKFNLDDELPLNETIDIFNLTILVRAVFHENEKYYPRVFLEECLYKL